MRSILVICVLVVLAVGLGAGCGSKEVTVRLDESKLTPQEKAQIEQMKKMQEQNMQMIVPAPAAGAQQAGTQQAPGN